MTLENKNKRKTMQNAEYAMSYFTTFCDLFTAVYS